MRKEDISHPSSGLDNLETKYLQSIISLIQRADIRGGRTGQVEL
jgi:hypothetical protein